ncbi:Single-stranded-DNA-specific exonuclease RecJ [BD1-7 clade bacterium]|uniref:Single-stranded-DNA-specific exonuclease RecJ n=1 Tax=BD1-7 clade bacterium TaxID=2029982 RepID=A0A5S9Q970_9GAMM|nr:Single-stranded-DNA-specific exonuclease RecJ [BD1-7 clade bacterium]CAA0114547.1 Single-stranded-DNA-specific exonuclease RecJ [BD1-7 clade bacterium]
MSLTKQIVRRPQVDQHQLPTSLHPLLRRLLASRGIVEDHQLQHELANLADPYLMKGMAQSVDRLQQALIAQQKIVIVGDFDADGATSSALCMLALTAMGFVNVSFTVPNRFEYGYGLSPAIVDELGWQKPDLLVTVDNGISSLEGVALANQRGMDVVITDHHLPGEQLPAAHAIINPNQAGCEFPSKALAGVGVVFHLLIALRKRLRESGWFSTQQIPEPNLANYLDIVALGTVADVVPLDYYNRILVAQGIKRIRAGRMRPGIQKLLALANRDHRHITSTDLGFVLGPRLNAAGRLDDMTQGIMLLMTDSEPLAAELAQVLDEFNRDRKQIEQQMQFEALQIVDEVAGQLESVPRGLCLFHHGWHQGVVGLVASRIKERYHRPVIAFAPADAADTSADIELKGSGRSIKGIHLRDVLDEVASANPGLLEKFGGHAMAAGLSLRQSQLPAFEAAFLAALDQITDDQVFEASLESDGEVECRDMNLNTAMLIRDAVPWGQAMPEPLFEGQFRVVGQRLLAGKHLKFQACYPDEQQPVDAIWFNCDTEQWPAADGALVDLVYRMSINHFRGDQILQLIVEQMTVRPA